jgi:hypothetical protein
VELRSAATVQAPSQRRLPAVSIRITDIIIEHAQDPHLLHAISDKSTAIGSSLGDSRQNEVVGNSLIRFRCCAAVVLLKTRVTG